MIVFGGFWFILAWCMTPFIIKGAKKMFMLAYVFIVLMLSVTYGLPIVFALLPYVIGVIGFAVCAFLIYFVCDTRKEHKLVNSVEYKENKAKTLSKWNAKKAISKNKLMNSNEEVTEYKIVMGAYDVTNDEVDEYLKKGGQ